MGGRAEGAAGEVEWDCRAARHQIGSGKSVSADLYVPLDTRRFRSIADRSQSTSPTSLTPDDAPGAPPRDLPLSSRYPFHARRARHGSLTFVRAPGNSLTRRR